jgi:hypothetical protein
LTDRQREFREDRAGIGAISDQPAVVAHSEYQIAAGR